MFSGRNYIMKLINMKMDIKTERLKITYLTMNMVEDYYNNSLDEDNRRFVPDEVFESIEEVEKTIEWLMNSYQSPTGPLVYAVITKENINIGYVQACKIQEGWELGYHIAKQYTGNGFATEAVKAFLPIIMLKLNINVIYGIVLEENYASHKVLEKCGFILVFKGIGKYQGRELRRYFFERQISSCRANS